ncbi:hypothetical protein GS397_23235 [Sphingobium yanoikuyae]|uniref:Uncharacterized protein n=1 Tax=Sphingobium yanoikuyae TaxID=13690 RepID=A0A6P1GMN5_SPHYA|nr:hypothetical protein [Sphingobium yanoikuyae]QHD69660.1 hypothetical protein GS397_23235 [Sphingobium yanoikuyae]
MLAIAFGTAGVLVLAFCLPFAAILPLIIDDPAMLNEARNPLVAYFEIAAPFVAAATLGLAFLCYRTPTIRWAICLAAPSAIWAFALAVTVVKELQM